MIKEKTCDERIAVEMEGRLEEIKVLWELWGKDSDLNDDEYGNFIEYGLCFDYVQGGTQYNEDEGYFRYQLSYGGPSDEFRFFTDAEFNCYRIEYWFLDWNDGASRRLFNDDKELMLEIFNWFYDSETVKHEFKKATQE